MRDRSHDDAMADTYRKDPGYAMLMLNTVLSDKDAEPYELLIVLRQLAKAAGGVQSMAQKADLNPTQLYRTLSPAGNPELKTAIAILKALGLQLMVKPIQPAKRARVAKTSKASKSARAPRTARLAKAA